MVGQLVLPLFLFLFLFFIAGLVILCRLFFQFEIQLPGDETRIMMKIKLFQKLIVRLNRLTLTVWHNAAHEIIFCNFNVTRRIQLPNAE